jgi:hypothetical protein
MNHGKITPITIIGDAPQSSAELAAATPLTRGQTSGAKFPLVASATAHSRPDRVEWAVFYCLLRKTAHLAQSNLYCAKLKP